MKPIKTKATAKSKNIEAIVSGGMLYYAPKSKNQMHIEKHYFLEWKNRLIKIWEDKGNLEMQKEMKALTIRDYRNNVKRIFQNRKEIENNPNLKKELKEYRKTNLMLQKFLMTITTTGDYRNKVKRFFQKYKELESNDLKEIAEKNFQLREKIENYPDLKWKNELYIKAYRAYIKELIAANYGDVQAATEDIIKGNEYILNKTFSETTELERQKLVKALYIGDYRKIPQNYKEILEKDPILKELVEVYIKDREEIENYPILKKKHKHFTKEFRIFLKKEIAVNNGVLPATKDIVKEAYKIWNRTFLKDSKIKNTQTKNQTKRKNVNI